VLFCSVFFRVQYYTIDYWKKQCSVQGTVLTSIWDPDYKLNNRGIMIKEVLITEEDLSVNDIIVVARDNAKVAIVLEAQQRVKLCRSFVKNLVSSRQMVYGIKTRFS